VFTGDATVRTVNDAMLAAVSAPVNGVSPSTVGITLTKTGTVSFDQAAFTAAMAKDPAGTMATYQSIAARIATAATAVSDPLTGSLTTTITSEQGRESSMTGDVSTWDTRLAAIQDRYQKQFNALETALSGLSSQATWLTSQLSGLPTNYEKN
jgi:flagellar hook-associated protein 2